MPRDAIRENKLTMLVVIFALLPLAVGCDDGMDRVKMSGKVIYDGKPVQDGMIRFMPKPGTERPLTIEPIKNGLYNTNTSGGVPSGSYKVDIRSFNPDDPIPMGPGEPERRQLLPAKYNNRTELEITLKPGQKKLEHDFILEK
ncbi:MAG: hypothetical protein JXM70_27245 [Pirellulales bacterium]|nr:hypothetical protein [Pirellulales bacterium]